MLNSILDKLVADKHLLYYDYEQKESEPDSGLREYEQLRLYFPGGTSLKVSAHSSGASENVSFTITTD